MPPLRVGVVFGGRSGEHEVSLASAASVIAALERGGHRVVPLGIARDGRWIVGGDPLRALANQARVSLSNDDTGSVKKALADRAEAQAAGDTALVRIEPAGGLPAGLSQGLDVVVIMLHGPYGEDGTIQGLFELADLPYVGAGVLASAVGMDKVTMKAVFRAHGLPMVEHSGSTGGYRTDIARFPSVHTSVVTMCNVSTAAAPTLALRTADVVLGSRFPKPVPPAPVRAAGAASATVVTIDATAFAGRFYSDELNATYDLFATPNALVLRRAYTGPDTLRAVDRCFSLTVVCSLRKPICHGRNSRH